MTHARMHSLVALAAILVLAGLSTAHSQENQTRSKDMTDKKEEGQAVAIFGGGCFWCTEAVFERLEGVDSVVSGYAGGTVPNPTYRQVCSGTTGHAEVIRIAYDPGKVPYEKLLEIFFKYHDPTTLNRQGNDVGTQYRSVIFAQTPEQRKLAEARIRELDKAGAYDVPIVTTVEDKATFYPAEDHHQDYFRLNPNVPYCRFVIRPKVEKFRQNEEQPKTEE